MNGKEFGELIRAERVKKGITQKKKKKMSGFTRVAINYWERQSRAITLENADKLLKALEIEVRIGKKNE